MMMHAKEILCNQVLWSEQNSNSALVVVCEKN